MKDHKPARKIWKQLTDCFVGAMAINLVFLIIFINIGKTIWDLPLFYLVTAILILLSSALYLVIKQMHQIVSWKKKVLIGLTVVNFLLLILTSGLAFIGAIISMS